MSNSKPRRNRIQGGWASGNGPRSKLPSSNSSSDSNSQSHSDSKSNNLLSASTNSESKCAIASWIGKDVDLPPSVVKYIPPEEKELKAPKVTTDFINTPGVYDISTQPSGISRVRLFHKFLTTEQADKIFAYLHEQISWEQKSDVKDGVRYMQPRLVAWFGDVPYSYSGLSHPTCSEWPAPLKEIQHQLETNIGQQFNSVLCNLYRDGKDHVSWHSDNEDIFGQNPTIASISLGDTRNFELRKKVTPNEKGILEYEEYVKIPLEHGSLLIMEGATQKDWEHRIPKEYHDRSARINLTYRYTVNE